MRNKLSANYLIHMAKLVFLALLIILPCSAFPSKVLGLFQAHKHHHHSHSNHRTKRNLGQLIALVVQDTPYTFYKMSGYGNWCGLGGDRMGDGSYVDGCDLCCKTHDECYYTARHKHSGCNPLLTMYHYRHGGEGPTLEGNTSAKKRELEKMRNLPSCLSTENEGPSCKEAICQCDVNFSICLKKEPCDPKKVSKRSTLWWLPG